MNNLFIKEKKNTSKLYTINNQNRKIVRQIEKQIKNLIRRRRSKYDKIYKIFNAVNSCSTINLYCKNTYTDYGYLSTIKYYLLNLILKLIKKQLKIVAIKYAIKQYLKKLIKINKKTKMKTSQKSSVLEKNEFFELKKFIEANLSFEQIKHLSLELEKLTKDDFPIIASKIEKCSNLKYLNLQFCQSNRKIFKSPKLLSILGISLTKCKNLCALQMNFSLQEIGEKGGFVIASIIRGCKNLQIFNLFGFESSIRGEGLSRIATALSKCPNLKKLMISICADAINDEDLENLGSNLAKCQSLQEFSLNISDNCFSDNGLSKLGLNLAKSVNIKVLKINTYDRDPTDIKPTSKGYYDLCVPLSNLRNLKEFSLGFCWELDNACLSQVGLALKTCKNLLKLSLAVDFEVTDQYIEEFYSHIKNYSNLIQLDLFIGDQEINRKKIERKILKMPRIWHFFLGKKDTQGMPQLMSIYNIYVIKVQAQICDIIIHILYFQTKKEQIQHEQQINYKFKTKYLQMQNKNIKNKFKSKKNKNLIQKQIMNKIIVLIISQNFN
ncbi:hypothetical protein TTHERM_01399520 (macronuclear) [Tetrahymena thermophila SB210]|uniref:Kinase domain protein n=1 Tax=Tetrahymena thermophila (strain SB210) TaxID=312017 RepID=Q239H3_TETTS|nr:hypothetical protein TTHERM_01399520 [Tetrahymena thermophila SB210]EAR93170.2 hypothetical protein TTHERM_01399520 [Tetrahymena thermophila SB210]|eukprot:XP_001013415.2 hypothetical protein TTHERM_01399520 [Tetrahymena thermophila SB210]